MFAPLQFLVRHIDTFSEQPVNGRFERAPSSSKKNIATLPRNTATIFFHWYLHKYCFENSPDGNRGIVNAPSTKGAKITHNTPDGNRGKFKVRPARLARVTNRTHFHFCARQYSDVRVWLSRKKFRFSGGD